MTDHTNLKTLIIGIDAGCLPVLEPLFEVGALPHLQSVFTEGVSGELRSQIPPWTASAWPSLYTGVNPGKHGVFGFLTFEGYDWDVVNQTHVQELTLWELLDHHGYSSVVVNVPVTHPARPFDGALIPGYVAPEEPVCHPAGVLDDVRDAIGGYRVYARETTDRDELVDEYRTLTRMRGEAFRYLADRYDPDFGFIQFQQTDTVFHELPGDDEAVEAVYRTVDEQVGKLLADCAPDTVFVVSDHGMGPYDRYEFRMNEFLREHGYLETKNGGTGMPTWVTARDQRLRQGEGDTQHRQGPLEQLAATAARAGFTAQRVIPVLDALGLRGFVSRHAPSSVTRAATTQVDFERSRAYMRDAIELGVRINLEGRDPMGIVSRAEYEPLRAELIERLRAVTTPDGDPLFEEVVPREQYFTGPWSDDAVDIVTIPTGFEHSLTSQLGESQFVAPREPWNHKLAGVVAARGVAIEHTAVPDDAHLYDIAPTVLATFGLSPHERMDGGVLPFVRPAHTLTTYPEFVGGVEARTDDTSVEQRLANLGYLE